MLLHDVMNLVCVAGLEGVDQRLMLLEDLVAAFVLKEFARIARPSRMNVPVNPLTDIVDQRSTQRVSIQYSVKLAICLE